MPPTCLYRTIRLFLLLLFVLCAIFFLELQYLNALATRRLKVASSFLSLHASIAGLSRWAMITTYPPQQCGVAKFAWFQVQAARTLGISIEVYVLRRRTEMTVPDYGNEVVGVVCVDCEKGLHQLVTKLNSLKYDAVFLQHEFAMYPKAMELSQALSRLASPLYSIIHSPFRFPSPFEARVMNELFHLSAALLVMSEASVRHLLFGYGFDRNQILFFPHGAETIPVHLCTPKSFAERKSRAYPPALQDKQIILMIGLFHRSKGIIHMIRALKHIVDHVPHVIMVFLGSVNSGESNNFLSGIKTEVARNHLEDHVLFLSSFVDEDHLTDAIIGADLVVTPYEDYTPVSGVLTFSLSVGSLVLSTPYNYVMELAKYFPDALEIACFSSPSSLAAGAISLLSDEFRKERACQAAARNPELSWNQTTNTFLRAVLGHLKTQFQPGHQKDTSIRTALIGDANIIGFDREPLRLFCERPPCIYSLLTDYDVSLNIQSQYEASGCRIQGFGLVLGLDTVNIAVGKEGMSIQVNFKAFPPGRHILSFGANVSWSASEATISYDDYFFKFALPPLRHIIRISNAERTPHGYLGQTSRGFKPIILPSGEVCTTLPSVCQGCVISKIEGCQAFGVSHLTAVDSKISYFRNPVQHLIARHLPSLSVSAFVHWVGPVFDHSGFATANRENCLWLHLHPRIRLRIMANQEFGYSNLKFDTTLETARFSPLREIIQTEKPICEMGGIEVRMQWPVDFARSSCTFLVLYQPFEFGV